LGSVTAAEPLNRMVDLAGPDAIPLAEVVRQFLKATRARRTLITDEQAPYFGIPLKQRSLVPNKNQLLGATDFEAWLRRSVALGTERTGHSRGQSTALPYRVSNPL
jgi:uncharacterized protein YbjT (DUF2867 family)